MSGYLNHEVGLCSCWFKCFPDQLGDEIIIIFKKKPSHLFIANSQSGLLVYLCVQYAHIQWKVFPFRYEKQNWTWPFTDSAMELWLHPELKIENKILIKKNANYIQGVIRSSLDGISEIEGRSGSKKRFKFDSELSTFKAARKHQFSGSYPFLFWLLGDWRDFF